jgi:hypothetical protein
MLNLVVSEVKNIVSGHPSDNVSKSLVRRGIENNRLTKEELNRFAAACRGACLSLSRQLDLIIYPLL